MIELSLFQNDRLRNIKEVSHVNHIEMRYMKRNFTWNEWLMLCTTDNGL